MVTRRDYSAEGVEAAKSVLIELVQLLGEFRDQMVVVGGWVPVLLLMDAREPHVGTLDIDLALDFRNIPEASYQTLLEALTSRGYRQDPEQPFRFFRDVPSRDAGRYPWKLICSRASTEGLARVTERSRCRTRVPGKPEDVIWSSKRRRSSLSRAPCQAAAG